jgi:hypothetical protein
MATESSSSPPTYRDAADPDHERVVTAYAAIPRNHPKSSCITDTIDVGLLIALPCEPMARASSSVGISYAGVFVLVALVYGGGIACFVESTQVRHSLFYLSTSNAVLAGWILFMMGPVASGACLFFGWVLANIAPYLDEDPTTKFDASTTSLALVVIHYSCQLLFLAILVHLRHEILARSHAVSCCPSCIGSFCFTLCFPCCSFAEAMQRARASQQDQSRQVQADELPAYIA